MTLDEAIKHCDEKAEELKEKAESNIIEITKEGEIRVYDGKEYDDCLECAKEHEQLAEWLTQLKQVQNIAEHWNDESSSFVSACNAFEDILYIFKMGIGDMGGEEE